MGGFSALPPTGLSAVENGSSNVVLTMIGVWLEV
jgi:hypothetical protein